MAEQSQKPGQHFEGKYQWVPHKQHVFYNATLYILQIHTATIHDIFSGGYFMVQTQKYG